MIDAEKAYQQADEISGLLEERLGLRGNDLAAKLNKAGRSVPKWVRVEAEKLVQAVEYSQHPKLMRQSNQSGQNEAFKRVKNWVLSIDPKERKKDKILRFIGGISFNLLLFFGLLVAALVFLDVL